MRVVDELPDSAAGVIPRPSVINGREVAVAVNVQVPQVAFVDTLAESAYTVALGDRNRTPTAAFSVELFSDSRRFQGRRKCLAAFTNANEVTRLLLVAHVHAIAVDASDRP